MAKIIDYQAVPDRLEQIDARSRPAAMTSLIADWTFGPNSDREPGNPCMGIAIGCVLSLPIWLGVALCYILLA